MKWGRGVALLRGGFTPSLPTILRLVGVKREVRLVGVVAVMVVEVRVALNGGEVCSTIAIIVGVGGSPYLALLRPPRRPFILLGEAVLLASPLTTPLLLRLLLVGRHPGTLVREVAVVAPPTHIVMRVVAASLGPHLGSHWWWGLI